MRERVEMQAACAGCGRRKHGAALLRHDERASNGGRRYALKRILVPLPGARLVVTRCRVEPEKSATVLYPCLYIAGFCGVAGGLNELVVLKSGKW